MALIMQGSMQEGSGIRLVTLDETTNPELTATEAGSSIFAVEMDIKNIQYDHLSWSLLHSFPVRLRYQNVVDSKPMSVLGQKQDIWSQFTGLLDISTGTSYFPGMHCSVPLPDPDVFIKFAGSFSKAKKMNFLTEQSAKSKMVHATTEAMDHLCGWDADVSSKNFSDCIILTTNNEEGSDILSVYVPVGSLEWLPLVLVTTCVVQILLFFIMLYQFYVIFCSTT
jgi:hypothetical protein